MVLKIDDPDPRNSAAGAITEAEVRRALSGNICRCTGYQQIVEAVLSAAEERRCGGRA